MKTIEIARQLGTAIQQSATYKKLEVAKIANDNDEKLQNLIGEFNLKRVAINELITKQDENNNEKVTALDTEMKEIYNEIMTNLNMIEYNKARNEIDVMMNEINTILMKSVNGEDPETCSSEQESACNSGGCSSCSGCH